MSDGERRARRARPTQGREAELKGGTVGKPDSWLGAYIFGWQVAATGPGWREENIFGSRVSGDRASGTGYQVRVRVRVLNLYLMLNIRT